MSGFRNYHEDIIKYRGISDCYTAIQNVITTIEVQESNNSRRYQLLKYHLGRLREERDNIIIHNKLKPIFYKFEKEKGKTVLKVTEIELDEDGYFTYVDNKGRKFIDNAWSR